MGFLNKNFEMFSGPADHFVGLIISRERSNKKIFLSAPQYIDKILSKFNMIGCHPVAIPVDQLGPRLTKAMSPSNQEKKDAMACIRYREAVGSIIYVAITARPDIAYIAGLLAQHCENLGLSHWKSTKRVLKYLGGIREHGLCFGDSDSTLPLTGYSDAD